MKKLLTAFAVLGMVILARSPVVRADDEPLDTTENVVNWEIKDTTEVALGISSGGAIFATRGFVNVTERWFQPQTMTTGTIQGPALAGGILVSTKTLRGGATTYGYFDVSTQPVSVPRNVVIYSSPTFLGITTTTLKGVATFYGLNNLGNWAVEAIRFSTAPAALSSATNVSGQGDVAWSYISSFTVQITSMSDTYGIGTGTTSSNATIFIGYGNKLGLANDVTNIGDVYLLQEDASQVTPVPGKLNTDYNTYYPTLLPNGSRSYGIWQRIKNSPRK